MAKKPGPTLAKELNALLHQHRNRAFWASDPMQLPARYALAGDTANTEATALVTALLCYGYRPSIIAKLKELEDRLGSPIHSYLQTFSEGQAQRHLKGFSYRFNTGNDLVWLLQRLYHMYSEHGSLEGAWLAANPTTSTQPVPLQHAMAQWMKLLVGGEAFWQEPQPYGRRYLCSNPSLNGACKRLHLFLRWVVRDDADLAEPVDFGLWQRALSPAELLMPLDTHVLHLSQQWGLLPKGGGSWKQAEALTAQLRHLRPHDPLAYDFAFMGAGTA